MSSVGTRDRSDLISVIMANYNYAAYIAKAIDSVLGQTHSPVETIVVDDGSTVDMRPVLEPYGNRITTLYEPHAGISATRNKGIAKAAGRYYAFLDSDDYWPLDKLAMQYGYLQNNPACDMVYSYSCPFHSEELSPLERARLSCSERPMPAHVSNTLLIRKSAYERIGIFDTSLQIGVDIDLHSRIMASGLRYFVMPETLHFRRIHGRNHSQSKSVVKGKHAHVDVIKAHLDRMRKSAS